MDVLKRVAIPLIGIFAILLLATLSLAASFLMPVTAAILLYLVLSRPRRLLTRLGVPPGATAMLFTTMIFASFGAAMMWFAEPVGELLEDLPWQIERAQRAIAVSGGGALGSVAEAVEAIEGVIEGEPEDAVDVAVVEDAPSATVNALTFAPIVIGQIAFTIFLLYFLGLLIEMPPALAVTTVLPRWNGVILGCTCLIQFAVSMMMDSRYEKGLWRDYFWVIWYPLAFWMLSMATTVVAVPKAYLKQRGKRAVWVSPDRGLRP